MYRFLLRWFVNGLGLWLAARLFTDSISLTGGFAALAGGGFVLSIVNAFIKPLIVVLSLPAILLSLGLFMVVVNGFTVLIAAYFYEPLEISGLGVAVLAGLIIGLVNYALSTLVEDRMR